MSISSSFRFLCCSTLLIICHLSIQAQEEDNGLLFKDHTYLSNIRTVTLHPIDNPFNYPILTLNAQSKLTIDTLVLGFDDLSEDISSYVYTVQLCNKNWEPAQLPTGHYIDGYENENIDTYEPASSTITPYIHYQLKIPNENFSLKTSGNYLLKVYEDEEQKRLAFTKRFLVVQPLYKIEGKLVPTNNYNKRNTHHEIDFLINHENQTIKNATSTISATILQNYRWDTAIENIAPNLLKEEKTIFDFNDKIVFDALREYRQLDNRSFDNRSMEVQKVERFADGILVQQKPEEKRKFTAYNNRGVDINGTFFIQNLDAAADEDSEEFKLRQVNTLDQPYNFLDPIHLTRSDYSINQFKLNYPQEIENADVYIFGGFTNYDLNDEFKMTYNADKSRYEGTCLLKQGYYEYFYAVVDRKDETIDLQPMEPNLFETENEYLILIYHTPFGAQNDYLIGTKRISSGLNKN